MSCPCNSTDSGSMANDTSGNISPNSYIAGSNFALCNRCLMFWTIAFLFAIFVMRSGK